VRMVALSGYGQDSDIQAALEAGFDEHLTKPTDPARLEQLLKGTRRDQQTTETQADGH
jgi:CheY-like chemotaxis protein